MWSFTFLESLMECTLLWVGTNQQSRQSGSSLLNTGAEKGIGVLIMLVNEFSWCSSISAAFSTFKHAFLFIENFLLLLKLNVNICTHSALAIFKRFPKGSSVYKYLSSIWLNNTFCTAGRILHLLNTNASNSKLSMIIDCSFRPFNLADISLLMNPLTSLKLQRRHSFQHTVK